MAAPLLTWQNLSTYKFPTPPPPLVIHPVTDTADYTARNPPPRHIQPRLSIPDQSLPIDQRIVPRALAALQHGLASLTELPPIPADLQGIVQLASMHLSEGHHETLVMMHAVRITDIATQLIKAIFMAVDGRNPSFVPAAPPRHHSQQEHCDLTITSQAPHLSSTISFELENTGFAFAYGGSNGLQETISLDTTHKAHDAAAIAIKLSLQMAHAVPPSRFGLIYTGHTFMVAELGRVPNNEGIWVLMSSLCSVFDDHLYNAPDTYHLNFPNGLSSAPILACLVAFGCCTLPGFEIDPLLPIPILPNLSASPDNSKHDLDSDNEKDDGYNNDDISDCDDSYVGDLGTSGESSSTIILGPKGSKGVSCSSNSYLFGPPLQGLVLHVMTDPALLVAYDHPELASTPRLALPVTFVFEDPDAPQPLLHSPNNLSLWKHSVILPKLQGIPTSGNLTHLSSKIRTFLEFWSGDTRSVPLFSIHPQQFSCPSLPIRLFEHIGSGRTSDVWHAEVKGVDGLVTVKMAVFPCVGLDKFVPQYYGTYASCGGGWYAIVLEDVGVPVGTGDLFPPDNLPLKRRVRQIRRAFEKAGIFHGDIRPPNVLQAPDGTLRLIDFGISTLTKQGIHSQQHK